MSKDPAVLFYTSDFLSGTSFFTDEECGQYIRLLCQQHQLGYIPESHLLKICGSLQSPVAIKFIKDENGNYINERMKIETDKRKAFSESRRKNVEKRYRKSTLVPTYVSTSDLHMENENGNEDRIKDKENNNTLFQVFWAIYPRKEGKGTAIKAWNKISSPVETLQLILDAIKWQIESNQWKKDNGQYIPMPSTYLNQQRWLDEKKLIEKRPYYAR